MSFVSKDYLKMQPVSCTNIHHDVTGLVNRGMVKMQEFEYLEKET